MLRYLGHSLSSFLDRNRHPVPAARKMEAKRKPVAQPREANEVKMNKNSKNQPQISRMLERKSFMARALPLSMDFVKG
ncbi:hypothetical protein J7I93_23675 [Bacillus sp. ISL-47]|uniref:hypothetical protein n=1 Tax=Bacillus sp. ISL-47 TaxID=2819130 RepID=UPI001BE90FF3|nr:hypothetical protein [Bacillus sp. ISL-47]MBT2691138.1 hypothetical protein [Bacillus sp. ISL-47]